MYASSRDGQATALRDPRLHDGGRVRRRCCAPGLTCPARVSRYDHDPVQQTGSPRRACGALGSVGPRDGAATGFRGPPHAAGRAAGAGTAAAAAASAGTAIVGARAAGAGSAVLDTGAAAASSPVRRTRAASAGTAAVRHSGVADAAGKTVPRSRWSTAPEGRAERVRRDRAAAGVERNQESPGRTSEPAEWRERTKQCTKQRGRDRQRSGSSRWELLLRPAARVVSCSAPEGCGPGPEERPGSGVTSACRPLKRYVLDEAALAAVLNWMLGGGGQAATDPVAGRRRRGGSGCGTPGALNLHPYTACPPSPTRCTLRMYTCVSRFRSSKPGGNWDA
jgi:hypothetical protein